MMHFELLTGARVMTLYLMNAIMHGQHVQNFLSNYITFDLQYNYLRDVHIVRCADRVNICLYFFCVVSVRLIQTYFIFVLIYVVFIFTNKFVTVSFVLNMVFGKYIHLCLRHYFFIDKIGLLDWVLITFWLRIWRCLLFLKSSCWFFWIISG